MRRKPFFAASATFFALAAGLAAQTAATAPAVTASLTVTGEFWRNVSGGLATGSRWNSIADLSVELDLARVGGPAGSALVTQLFWIENQHTEADFCDLTGAANPVSGINAADS